MKQEENDKMSRRRFLQVSGSLLIGAAFAGVIGRSLWKMLTNPGELFYDAEGARHTQAVKEMDGFVSPYRRTFGFEVPDEITAMEMMGDQIALATPNNVYLYGMDGALRENFSVRSDLRDIASYDDHLYLLFPARIEVYDRMGTQIQEWEACSDDADYCSLTVFEGGVFATDASAKIICQYHLDGTLARLIKSPNGFVVPSYSFGITNMGGEVYCSNPGRHLVERYTAQGEYVGSFGRAGIGAGEFSGCCNPVHVTAMPTGELLTSEKGVPRISCYGADGSFRSVLLDKTALRGGHTAYDVRVFDSKLIVAGGKKVSVFQYDDRRSAQTLCGACQVDCPMKIIS